MEKVKEDERREIADMQSKMYHRSQDMQKIQNEIERISEINSKLESDFDNQIEKSNKNIVEAGQIINSIDSIYRICDKLAQARSSGKSGRGNLQVLEEVDMDKFEKGDKKMQEKFIKNIALKLETAVTHVSDLVEIFQQLKAKGKQNMSIEAKKQNELAK